MDYTQFLKGNNYIQVCEVDDPKGLNVVELSMWNPTKTSGAIINVELTKSEAEAICKAIQVFLNPR